MGSSSVVPPPPPGFTLDQPQSTGAAIPPPPPGFTLDKPAVEGEQTNDIGKTVIVPKDGESFQDTMQRAAAHGKTVTQQDINAEGATAPKKVAQSLGAAAGIGVAGPATLAAGGEAATALPGATEKVLQISETALEHLGENYPQLAKLATKLGLGAGALGAYKLLKKLGID